MALAVLGIAVGASVGMSEAQLVDYARGLEATVAQLERQLSSAKGGVHQGRELSTQGLTSTLPVVQECVDTVVDWKDQMGATCSDYVAGGWCTDTGGYGPGWHDIWGQFEDSALGGFSAVEACCGCGGGEAPPTPEPAPTPAPPPTLYVDAPALMWSPTPCQAGPVFFCEPVVTICPGVTAIPPAAFQSCKELVAVDIPDTVTEIGSFAFNYCDGLLDVYIPDSVTTIGASAFCKATALASVHIPDSVTNIGYKAFCTCVSLTSVHIPDAVTEISGLAFFACTSLSDVRIPDGVTDIGNEAFMYATNLLNVHIGAMVGSIGRAAFSWCSSLQTVRVPDATIVIEAEAFYECTSLVHVTLGESLALVGVGAFAKSCNVDTVVSRSARGVSGVFDRCAPTSNVTIEAGKSQKSMLGTCEHLTALTILSEDIESEAWSDCHSLEHVRLGDSVTSIGRRAFRSSTRLTSISLPDSVAIVGVEAFMNSSALSSVAIGTGVEYIGADAFRGCAALTSVAIPSPLGNARSIADVFDCSILSDVTFAPSLTGVADGALRGCTSVVSVTMPDAVVTIGANAFSGCPSLSTLSGGSHVTSIGDAAFSECSSLTHVPGEAVVSIGASAFKECTSLTHVALPSLEGSISEYSFAGCSSLASFTFGENVRAIESYAFHRCSGLGSVKAGQSINFIGDHAFESCSSLASVPLLDGVSSINEHAFAFCSSLASIQIPRLVDSIGASSFLGCSSLANVSILGTVASIGYSAFQLCSSLDRVTTTSSIALIGKNAFEGTWLECSQETFAMGVVDSTLVCACPAGHRFDGHSSRCVPCEQYLVCPGGHHPTDRGVDKTVKIAEGFMTLQDEPFSVYSCTHEARCPGERPVLSEQMCASKFDVATPRCAQCEPGTSLNLDGECDACSASSDATIWLKVALVGLAQLGLTYVFYRTSSQPATSFKGIMNSVIVLAQSLQTLSRLDLVFPSLVNDIMGVAGIVSVQGAIHQVQLKLECFGGSGFSFNIYMLALSPLLLFLNIAILQVIHMCFGRRMVWVRVHNLVGVIFTGLFLTLVTISLSLFFTVKMPNGKVMVIAFPELEYGSQAWWSVLPVNLASTLLYGVSTVAYVAYIVWTAPGRAASTPNFEEKYRFCFGSQRPDRWWWILVQLAYGVCLNCVQALFPVHSVYSEVYSSLTCIFIFTVLLFSCTPYKFTTNNLVDLACRLALISFLIFASSWVDTSNMDVKELSKLRDTFGNVVCFAVFGALLFSVCMALRDFHFRVRPAKILDTKSARAMWQLRDVGLATLLMPDAEFARKLSSVGDHDRALLQAAAQNVINVVFGEQISSKWTKQRLIADNDYRVWDHSAAVIGLMQETHTGKVSTAVLQSSHLRRKIIEMASAIYRQASQQRPGTPRRWRNTIDQRFQDITGVVQTGVANESATGRADTLDSSRANTLDRMKGLVGLVPATGLSREGFSEMLSSLPDLDVEVADANLIFDVMDVDSSGDVTIEEFTNCLSALAPERLVRAVKRAEGWDTDGDNEYHEQSKRSVRPSDASFRSAAVRPSEASGHSGATGSSSPAHKWQSEVVSMDVDEVDQPGSPRTTSHSAAAEIV